MGSDDDSQRDNTRNHNTRNHNTRSDDARDDDAGETDVIGGVAPPLTSAADRSGRSGALLPGRTPGQAMITALGAGAWLGCGVGLITGVILVVVGLRGAGGNVAPFALVGALIGALVGVLAGLVCGCLAGLAVFAGAAFGATERWAKMLTGAVGAALGVFAILGVSEVNRSQTLSALVSPEGPNFGAFSAFGALVALAAGVTAAFAIRVLDSDSRRAKVRSGRRPGPGTAGQGADGWVADEWPETGVARGSELESPVRPGPPPIPTRLSSDAVRASEGVSAPVSPTRAPASALSDTMPTTRAHLIVRVQRFRTVAVVLGVLSLVSAPWMLLARGSAFDEVTDFQADRPMAWYAMQFVVAVAVPAAAIGFAVAAALARRKAKQSGVMEGDLASAPWGSAVLAGIMLVLTLLSGVPMLGAVADVRAAGAENQTWLEGLHEDAPNSSDELPLTGTDSGLVPGTNPGEASTLTAAEIEAGMQALLDVAVVAAGPTAVWADLPGTGTRSGTSSTPGENPAEVPAEEPNIFTVEACAGDAGMSYVPPTVSFTTGVITDTSTDEHDREVTDGNVAAAERIVAAWEALGYNEDPSALGGNIDLGGGPNLPATSLHLRYSFGLVTLVRVGQCLPVG